MASRTPASESPLATSYDRIALAVEVAMMDTLRSFARTVPARRNDPPSGVDRRPEPVLAITPSMPETLRSLLGERTPTAVENWRRATEQPGYVNEMGPGPDYRVVQFRARRPSV